MSMRQQDLDEVVVLASQMQAMAHRNTVLHDETIDAIAEQTGIPEIFIDQAHRLILQRRAKQKKIRWWLVGGLLALVLVSALWWGRSLIPKDPQIVKAQSEASRNEAARLRKGKTFGLALKKAKEAVAWDPKSVLAWNELAVDYEELGLLVEAREAYHRSIELGGQTKDAAWAHYNLGRLLDEGSRKNEAIDYYRKAVDLDPQHANAHNNLGWTLEQLGRYDEAIASYRKAIAADPKYQQPRTNLKELLAKLGRSE